MKVPRKIICDSCNKPIAIITLANDDYVWEVIEDCFCVPCGEKQTKTTIQGVGTP